MSRPTRIPRPRPSRSTVARLAPSRLASALASTLAVLLFGALACRDAAAPPPIVVEPVITVAVTPERSTLVVGATTTLAATPRSRAGRPLDGRAIGWSSSDPAVATVSAIGRVTAVGRGVATIAAASEGRTGQAEITVTPPAPQPAVRLDVTPTGVTLVSGATRQLHAIVRDTAGNVLTDRVVTWTTDNAPVATVSATGLVAGTGAGYATIVAHYEGVTFGVAVTVETPEPGTVTGIDLTPPAATLGVDEAVQLTARPHGPDGASLDRPVAWTSGDTTIATVDAFGRVTGRGPGTAAIAASTDGVARRVPITVLAVRAFQLARVGGAPLPQTLRLALETDAAGVVRTVRWDAHAGMIRLRSDRQYEQTTQVWIVHDGSPAVQGTIGWRGTYRDDGIVPGQLVFTPLDARPAFSGRLSPDGTLAIVQRLEAAMPEVTLLYTQCQSVNGARDLRGRIGR